MLRQQPYSLGIADIQELVGSVDTGASGLTDHARPRAVERSTGGPIVLSLRGCPIRPSLEEWGEFCELDIPNKIVMTRRFGDNPLLEERERSDRSGTLECLELSDDGLPAKRKQYMTETAKRTYIKQVGTVFFPVTDSRPSA